MKKVLIFVISLALSAGVNTKAKAGVGVLENKEYNKHELAEFQQALLNKVKLKSGVITITQQNMIDVFKKHIATLFPGENFEDVIKNSTVEVLPADFQSNHKVGYIGADNTDGMDWFSRTPKTELGAEEGLKYKGKFWASKYCWNPIYPTSPSPSQQITYTPPPQQNGGTGNSGGGNTNTININPGSNQNQELSWNVGYAVYSQGRNDRQTDFLIDASLFKGIQDAKQCCGASVQTQMVSTIPISYTGGGGNNNSGGSQNSGDQTLTIKTKPNATDVINTIANVGQFGLHAVEVFRGYRIEGARNSYSNSGYYGGSDGTGRPSQGDLNSSRGGYYNNGGSYTGGGGIVQVGGFNW